MRARERERERKKERESDNQKGKANRHLVGVEAADAVVMAAALDNQPEQARSEEQGRQMRWIEERARIGMERQPGCPVGWRR